MISKQQLERLQKELGEKYKQTYFNARAAELDLENYTYSGDRRRYDPMIRQEKFKIYQEADYQAESTGLLLNFIRNQLEVKYGNQQINSTGSK